MTLAREIFEKLQTGDLKERSVELCVKCPLHRNYVLVVGNCVDANLRGDGKRGGSSVRLHGEPSDFWHDLTNKCQYANSITSKPTSGDLKGIICSYKKD